MSSARKPRYLAEKASIQGGINIQLGVIKQYNKRWNRGIDVKGTDLRAGAEGTNDVAFGMQQT